MSINDLPTPILVDILLLVPKENLVALKRVCKAWYKIIKDPQFARQHFSREETYLAVRLLSHSRIPRILHFVDPNNYICNSSSKMKLDTKFKIPIHNSEILFEKETQAKLTIDGGRKRKRNLDLEPGDHKLDILNSCKGLVCFSNQSISNKATTVICNPVTGEYVSIGTLIDGLGFSPKSNNYKVIRLFGESPDKWCNDRRIKPRYRHCFSSHAQIQILGSKSWNNIGLAPLVQCLSFPTFLKRTLNWLYSDEWVPRFIASFDFDSHQFGLFSLPPCLSTTKKRHKMRIGVLRDTLCYCNSTEDGFLHIWVMSEYGIEGTWTKVCNVNLRGGTYQPINQLENGAIILFYKKDHKNNGVMYYEPKTGILKCFRFGGVSATFEAIAFSPSFILLKDVLMGDEVKVLNVKSRCAELKIQNENTTPYMVQEDMSK